MRRADDVHVSTPHGVVQRTSGPRPCAAFLPDPDTGGGNACPPIPVTAVRPAVCPLTTGAAYLGERRTRSCDFLHADL